MTIKEKLEEVKAAYKVLRMFVRDDEYFAYIQGLLDAYELEMDARFEKQPHDQ